MNHVTSNSLEDMAAKYCHNHQEFMSFRHIHIYFLNINIAFDHDMNDILILQNNGICRTPQGTLPADVKN